MSGLLDVGSTFARGIDRRTRVLSHVTPSSKIIEIGGSYNPLAPRSDGYNTLTLDHAPREQLVEYYTKYGVATDRIEEVNFVCSDGQFDVAVGPEHVGTFDVCLSSHNVEHYPNPIRSLQAISRLLRPDGVLSLAVPDRRGSFDFFRPLTTTGSWIESYLASATRHRLQTVFDMQAYVVANDGAVTWHQTLPSGTLTFAGKTLDESFAFVQSLDPEYHDAHNSIFTPTSFLLLVCEAHALGLIDLYPISCDSNEEVEFYVDLVKRPRSTLTQEERMAMLKRIAREQVEGWSRMD